MTEKEREDIIEYIKTYDITYNYNAVDFKYYSDEDLLILQQRLIREKDDKEQAPLQ
jgi:hypothetical protein